MVEDLIKSAQAQIHSRIASPLMGSFAISWCLWNYKFIVVLLSENSVSTTFHLIESICFPGPREALLNGLIYPLITSAAYIFLYPYPEKLVYGYTRNRQKEINEIKQRIENETPLTIEESRNIRSALLSSEISFKEEIDKKNREIIRLKEELSVPRKPDNSTSVENFPSKVQKIESSQIKILREIENQNGEAAEKFIISNSGLSKTKTEFDLGELVSNHFLKKNYRSEKNDYVYTFTHDGRKLLLENKKEKLA